MREMSWAFAGKMLVEVILFLALYALLIVAVSRLMAWLAKKYPKLAVTHDEYYGTASDDYSDAVEGTEPPRAA